MVQEPGLLLSMWETQVEFLAPGFDLTQAKLPFPFPLFKIKQK